jgi:Zn-dependent peptidase ImmA (M78 family)
MSRDKAAVDPETLSFLLGNHVAGNNKLPKKSSGTWQLVSKFIDSGNKIIPTIVETKKMAELLNVPFFTLYLKKEYFETDPLSRAKPPKNLRKLHKDIDLDQTALNLAMTEMIRARDFIISAKKDLELPQKAFSPPDAGKTRTIQSVSETITDFFDLGVDNRANLKTTQRLFLDVRSKVEREGIFVHSFSGLRVDELRGMALWDETNPMIGINANDGPCASAFHVIHELVHVLKRESSTCNVLFLDSYPDADVSAFDEDLFCNAVASEVLVPESFLRDAFSGVKPDDVSYGDVGDLSRELAVDPKLTIRRLADLKLVSETKRDSFAKQIRDNDFLARKPSVQDPVTAAIVKNGSEFSFVLVRGHEKGYFSKEVLAGILGIHEKHVPAFAAAVKASRRE